MIAIIDKGIQKIILFDERKEQRIPNTCALNKGACATPDRSRSQGRMDAWNVSVHFLKPQLLCQLLEG